MSTGTRLGDSTPKWLSEWKPSPMEAILPLMSSADVLSFALGIPDPALLPHDVLAEAAARAIESPRSLQYCSPDRQLKEHVIRIMAVRGFSVTPDAVLITSGAQQALMLVAQLLLEERSFLMTEDLVYPNFKNVVQPYLPNITTVPTTPRSGIDVEALEQRLQAGPRPAFLYMMADGHNPLGISVPAATRPRLAEVMTRFGVPLVEDDAYGFLSYDQTPLRPVSSYAPEGMFYVGSFSKIIGPSLRVGWLVAPPRFAKILSSLKEAADINLFSLSQRIVNECLNRLDFDRHVSHLVREYRTRRDVIVAAVARYFPPSTTCELPSGGFFAWACLNEDIDATELCKQSILREKIAFLPGGNFAAPSQNSGRSCLRLAFSNYGPERLEEGIKRLGSVIETFREEHG